MWLCPYCESALDDFRERCVVCGKCREERKDTFRYCIYCGIRYNLSPENQFCVNCGRKLDD